MAKKIDPLKAKEKKQKIIAAVGGVILLALLAWQVPKVMKMMNKKPPVSSAVTTPTATPPAGTPTLAAPTLAGNEQAPPATSSTGTGLASGDVPPPLQTGELDSFSRFESKDPFAQQLSDTTATGGPTPSGSSGNTSSAGSPSGSNGGGFGSGSGPTSPPPGSAVISVNGTLMSVSVGNDFPQPTTTDPSVQPIFHLISLTAHTAKISIVGGSYSNGARAVILRERHSLTLMNTADGTRYKLVLEPQGTAVPGQAGSGSTSTTPTVTLPASTP